LGKAYTYLRIAMGDQRNKVFIGGVSWATDEKKFGEYFGPYGEITDCVIMRNPSTGNSRGFGFVTFADSSSVDKLFEAGEHVIDGKKLDIKVAVAREELARGSTQGRGAAVEKARRTCKIFVGGIHLETTKADLEECFGKYGSIVDATVMVDRESGRSRGFGFVTFQSEDSVDRLLQFDHEIRGRKVDCKKAVPREETNELPNMRVPRGVLQPDMSRSFDRDVRGFYDTQRQFEPPRRDNIRPPDQYRERPQLPKPVPAYQNQPYAPNPNAYASNGFTSSPASTGYTSSPNYNNGPPANSWEYASPVAPAYGGGAGGYGGESMYAPAPAYAQPTAYGAARPSSSTTSRYRPY